MENNLPANPTNQTQTSQQQVQPIPAQPATKPVSQMPPQDMAAKSHILRTLLIMIVFAIVVMSAIYIYLSLVNREQLDSSSVQIQNTISPAPTSAQITDEQELNSIIIGDVDADLQEIDTDLNSL